MVNCFHTDMYGQNPDVQEEALPVRIFQPPKKTTKAFSTLSISAHKQQAFVPNKTNPKKVILSIPDLINSSPSGAPAPFAQRRNVFLVESRHRFFQQSWLLNKLNTPWCRRGWDDRLRIPTSAEPQTMVVMMRSKWLTMNPLPQICIPKIY